MTGRWAAELLGRHPVQPDDRSCGASSLVVAHAVRDDAYAEFLVTGVHPRTGWRVPGSADDRFRREALGMHRRITGAVDLASRPQLPWPRALGTPPWAVSHQLSAPGRRYVVRQAVVGRSVVLEALLAALGPRTPVALFVGDRWSPRHVVLALEPDQDGFRAYDPASGRLRQVTGDAFVEGRLPFGHWHRPWLLVQPAGPG